MNRLSTDDTMTFAMLLCKKLAADLDADDRSSIEVVAGLLADLPADVWLVATKKNLHVYRIAMHDLDLNPDIKKMMATVLEMKG